MNVCPDDIFWTAKHFVTEPGMVMQYYEPDCLAEKMVWYLQGQGHSEGSYNQTFAVSTISSELLILLQPNLVWWYIIIKPEFRGNGGGLLYSRRRSQRRFRVTECWFRRYLLTRPMSCYRTKYGDASLLARKSCYRTKYSDASLLARMSCKKIGLLFSSQGHSEGSYQQHNITFCTFLFFFFFSFLTLS